MSCFKQKRDGGLPAKTHKQGYHPIFRASRRNPKTGEIAYARDKGKKCFVMWVKNQ
jgi:hypothetical protein